MSKIDKRWVEELAKRSVGKKKGTTMIVVGGILLVAGAFMGMNSYDAETGTYASNLITPAAVILLVGFIFIVIAAWQNNKREKEYRAEFMEYFNRTGELPPYPEETETTTDKVKPV